MVQPNTFVCLIFLLLTLTACKHNTLEDAWKNDLPYKVKDVIHIEYVNDGAIVMYTTTPKDTSQKFDAITVAYFQGNDKEGWKNAGGNGWDHYENRNLTLYDKNFHTRQPDDTIVQVPLVYGEINNSAIRQVKVAGKDTSYVDADIIETPSGRYYFKIGNYHIVEGLSKDGKVIDHQGGQVQTSQ